MNSRPMSSASLPFFVAVLMTASCSHSPSEVLRVPPSLEVVSGAGATDTIGTWLTQPLTVVMRDSSGKPAALAPVIFTVVPMPGATDPWLEASALVGPTSYAGAPNPQRVWRDWTDDAGRVAVMVRFGKMAGTLRIAIDGENLPAHDTATYTILPGAAVSLDVQPSDTAVYVDRPYALRVRSLDRANNVRADVVSLAGGDSVLALDGTLRVTGRRFGRDFTDVSTATHHARIWVSVVPQGTLAVTFSGYSTDYGVGLINLDGSGRRRLFGPARYSDAAHSPRWSRDGKSLIAVERDGAYIIDPQTGGSRTVPAAGARFPTFSADGRFLYYSTAEYQTNHYTLWRVRIDGTSAPEQLPVGMQYVAHHPDLSPDGTRMAYLGSDGYLHEMLLADSSDHRIGDEHGLATGPRYSPDGGTVAFLRSTEYNSFNPSNGVYVIPVQGTTAQRISPSSDPDASSTWTPAGRSSWSPDGRWVISITFGKMRIINVKTGLTLPLPWSGDYTDPDWQPLVGP
jgi:hypothetical protein